MHLIGWFIWIYLRQWTFFPITLNICFVVMNMDQYKVNLDIHGKDTRHQTPSYLSLYPRGTYYKGSKISNSFDVHGSVHHSTIRTEKFNKMQQCIKIFIIPCLHEAQHVLSDTSPIIRSLKLHWQPLVFRTWKVVGCVVGGCCQAQCTWQRWPTTCPTTFHVRKTRGCQCSFRLLMTGYVSLETCWASCKHGIIKMLIHCCILLDFSLQISSSLPFHMKDVSHNNKRFKLVFRNFFYSNTF
jgi:hypothetical protein